MCAGIGLFRLGIFSGTHFVPLTFWTVYLWKTWRATLHFSCLHSCPAPFSKSRFLWRGKDHSLCLSLMGEKVSETLSRLHLRLRTIAYTSRDSTVTLTEVTLTGVVLVYAANSCNWVQDWASKKKNDGFILSFFSNETFILVYFVGGFSKDCVR